MKEVSECLDDAGSNAVNRGELARCIRVAAPRLFSNCPQSRKLVHMLKKIARGDLADMTNTKAEKQPRGIGLALAIHSRQQIVHRLILPAFERENILAALAKPEDISRALKPAKLKELRDGLGAKAVDIKRLAANKVLKALGALRWANKPAGAAHINFAFLCHSLAAAFGTSIREDKGLAFFVAGKVLNHLRDHIARALDHHAVSRAHTQPLDLIAVVQRNIGDGHPAHQHRC